MTNNFIKPQPNFIENVDFSEWSLYADTDSSYSKIRLPFNKFEDKHRTVDFILDLAEHFNIEYQKTFAETVEKYGGVNHKYNRMYFKSEIVALRAFFNTKKNYGMAKLADEGKFFDPPAIKKTGGQILKSDSTKIVYDLLTEIYNIILKDFDITNEIILYRKIFNQVKEKYIKRTTKAVQEMNYKDFGIPKKWSMNQLKTIPKQVMGAMLFNYLFTDILRPGESLYQCQIKINPQLLLQYLDKHPAKSKYKITPAMVTDKLNVISFPVDMTESDFEKVRTVFHELNIQFDLGTILDFNVHLKISQFEKLFKEETIRMAL